MFGNEAQQFCVLYNSEAESQGWPMRCDAVAESRDKRLTELRALWQAKAQDGVPRRSDLGMREMKPFMRNIAIVERIDFDNDVGHTYKFRLFGSALSLVFGEHTGQTVEDIVLPVTVPGWIAFYDLVLSTGQPILLSNMFTSVYTSTDKNEVLGLPLADEEGNVRLAIGATFAERDTYARTPYSVAGPLSA